MMKADKNFDASKQESKQKKQDKIPMTLFQLMIFMIKNFTKGFFVKLIIASVACLIVLSIHTYLMVVINEGFRIYDDSKVLKYILVSAEKWRMIDCFRNLDYIGVMLFWILISMVFWGSIAQIKGVGFKVFFKRIISNIINLFSEIFERILLSISFFIFHL